ncbi:hypothetical protein [Streptomyces sp. WAC05374]|uniref:hypothetical protein n=1 Tax=Streptomyces sp. WAC05374 TaxID=2487420 RepID=UPI00135B3B5D|nr:hypothetical protein [Streptomyces sp. WAC05374]
MDAIQQHMIDAYRALRHGEAPPPPPGRGDLAALRAARDHHLRRSGDGEESTGCGQ